MAVASFAQGVTSSSYWSSHLNSLSAHPKTAAAATTSSGTTQITASGDGKSFFENVLDVVNPLQHLPVVGTIYRAITGDKIGDLEKVAGDTLYGGTIGLVSSLADLAFEKITGKDFGDTVLAMVGIGDKDTAVASNASTKTPEQSETAKTAALNIAALKTPPATQIALAATAPPAKLGLASKPVISPAATITTASAQTPIDISPQTDALLASLQRNGVTGPMQAQALDAYRRSMTMTAQSAAVH